MTTSSPTVKNAARLVYKALHTALSPVNDAQYRELLDLYRADPKFASNVQEVAEGLELTILDFSERGLIIVPTSRESRFAIRIGDIRTNMKPEQKAALVLAHVAVAATFFPTTDGLDDDNYVPPPASVAQFRDALYSLSRHLKEAGPDQQDVPPELSPGWELICSLPVAVPSSLRASPSSITGLIGMTLNHMGANGLARLDRDDSSDEALATYTATHRLRVQLRELTLRRLFELAQTGAAKAGMGA